MKSDLRIDPIYTLRRWLRPIYETTPRSAVERLGSIRKAAEASGISESTIKGKLRAARLPGA